MGLHLEEAVENEEFHCTSKKGRTCSLSIPWKNKNIKRLIKNSLPKRFTLMILSYFSSFVCLLKFLIFISSNSAARRYMPLQPIACWGISYAGIQAWSRQGIAAVFPHSAKVSNNASAFPYLTSCLLTWKKKVLSSQKMLKANLTLAAQASFFTLVGGSRVCWGVAVTSCAAEVGSVLSYREMIFSANFVFVCALCKWCCPFAVQLLCWRIPKLFVNQFTCRTAEIQLSCSWGALKSFS